jgi:hypothetical protein
MASTRHPAHMASRVRLGRRTRRGRPAHPAAATPPAPAVVTVRRPIPLGGWTRRLRSRWDRVRLTRSTSRSHQRLMRLLMRLLAIRRRPLPRTLPNHQVLQGNPMMAGRPSPVRHRPIMRPRPSNVGAALTRPARATGRVLRSTADDRMTVRTRLRTNHRRTRLRRGSPAGTSSPRRTVVQLASRQARPTGGVMSLWEQRPALWPESRRWHRTLPGRHTVRRTVSPRPAGRRRAPRATPIPEARKLIHR